jgi:hypothetical protein
MARLQARSWALRCAVAAAMLAVVAGCTSASPRSGSRPTPAGSTKRTPSAAATWYPAGQLPAANAAFSVAPYFVTLASQRQGGPATVTDALTGQVLASVSPPAGSTGFTGVVAADDDHTFVLAAQSRASAVRFYELRLGPAGQPRPVVRLPVPALADGGAFAVSADGSKLAIATATAKSAGIEVVSLASRGVRAWKAPGGHVTDLSWSGSRLLAFLWSDDGSGSTGVTRARSGVRLLDTATAGGDLMASRLIIDQAAHTRLGNFTGLAYPLISADGSKVFATTLLGGPAKPKAEVVEFSALTGQALAVAAPATDETGMHSWCGVLWTNPSGTRATAACGGQGRIVGGRFTSWNLHAPTYGFSTPRDSFIAW